MNQTEKLATILLIWNLSVTVFGQNCFVVSDDITGLENQTTILEQEACSLRDSLPNDFQNDFKVIHVGLYLHTPDMIGAKEEFKTSVIQKASTISPNYLLIIHQLFSDGHSEYDAEIKLPENWLPECYDELIINAFVNSVKAKFLALQIEYPSPYQKTQVEIEGMEYLAKRLGEFTQCCLPGSSLKSSSCSSCITAYNVLNELENLGFSPFFAGEVTNSDPDTDQNCLCTESTSATKPNDNSYNRKTTGVQDYAELTISLDNESYDFATELSDWANQGNEAIVTKNANYCDLTLFQNLQSAFNNSTQAVWVHVWENPKQDDEDIVFLKMKESHTTGNIAPSNIQTQQIQTDPPPPHEYTILHRSFAPWDRFGHLPILPNVHIARNSFWGDNRGFSLNDPDLVFPGTTARIHQRMKVKLGSGKVPLAGQSKFSSLTRGYENFKKWKAKRIIPHPYKEELDRWEYEPAEEKEDFCNPSGFENSMVENNITYTAMFFEGSDPLIVFPMVAPDIEWYLKLGLYYKSNDNTLNISGLLMGKSFPAYEAYIEDKCGNKMFLYTYAAPCESQLAVELLNPLPDYYEGFDISVKIDENGCFQSGVTTSYGGNTENTDLQSWNQTNLSKAAAKDCPSNPCQGAYPNDGSDKTDDFNCGN
ncbi:MAG TPA: hypothetical protein ENJ28_12225 [Gammaproteobacteria bacterium]|nr:hypothetical protein [Gammaproteobacteria bacterium]